VAGKGVVSIIKKINHGRGGRSPTSHTRTLSIHQENIEGVRIKGRDVIRFLYAPRFHRVERPKDEKERGGDPRFAIRPGPKEGDEIGTNLDAVT